MRLIFAYLDPGSSSMIVQMFLGGLAAAGVALKLYWRRFLKFLHIRKDDDLEQDLATRRSRKAAKQAAEAVPPASATEREPVETTKS
jgi:hypothetical protein